MNHRKNHMSAMEVMFPNEITYDEYDTWTVLRTESRVPGLVIGPPGIGKTMIPRGVADRLVIGRMETLAFNYDQVDFRGLLVPDPSTMTTLSYSLAKWPLARFVRENYGKEGGIPPRGIFLLDDFLNSKKENMDSMAEPLLDHTIDGEPLAPGWVIIATGNPLGGGTSAKALPTHVTNRINIVRLKPNWDAWLKWATGVVRPELIAYYQHDLGANLFHFEPPKNPNEPFQTPRSVENLSKELNAWFKLRPNEKPPLWIYTSNIGQLGQQVYATVDYLYELAKFEEIIVNPKGAKLASANSAGAVFAQMSIVIGGLKMLSSEKKMPADTSLRTKVKNAGIYIERFEPELRTAIHQRALTTVSYWADTPEYEQWFVKDQVNIA